MTTLRIAAAVALSLGCTPKADPPTPAAPKVVVSAPASAAPADRWARPPAREPSPQAKALYRRALDLVAQGRLADARSLFDQIRRDHPDSRFALRLVAPGGRSGGPIALLASLATLLAVGAQE